MESSRRTACVIRAAACRTCCRRSPRVIAQSPHARARESIAETAVRGVVDAAQLELSVAIRMPGDFRARCEDAIAEVVRAQRRRFAHASRTDRRESRAATASCQIGNRRGRDGRGTRHGSASSSMTRGAYRRDGELRRRRRGHGRANHDAVRRPSRRIVHRRRPADTVSERRHPRPALPPARGRLDRARISRTRRDRARCYRVSKHRARARVGPARLRR